MASRTEWNTPSRVRTFVGRITLIFLSCAFYLALRHYENAWVLHRLLGVVFGGYVLHLAYAWLMGWQEARARAPNVSIGIFAVNLRSNMDWGRVLPVGAIGVKYDKGANFADQHSSYKRLVAVIEFFTLAILPLVPFAHFMYPRWFMKGTTKPEVYPVGATASDKQVWTYTPTIFMTSAQMAQWQWWAKVRVLHMVLYSVLRYRPNVVVMGAHTAPRTGSGRHVEYMLGFLGAVLGILPGFKFLSKVLVSHGDTLSVAISDAQTEEWMRALNLHSLPVNERPVFVAGGTGMIGMAHVLLFAMRGYIVYFSGRTPEKVQQALVAIRARLPESFRKNVHGTVWVNGASDLGSFRKGQDVIKECPVIVLATSATEEVMGIDHLRSDRSYILVDVGAPHNAPREFGEVSNLRVRDGAIATAARFAKYPAGFEMGVMPQGTYACHGEMTVLCWTLLGAPERLGELQESWQLTGSIDPVRIEPLLELAKEAGLGPASPSWYGRPYELRLMGTDEQFAHGEGVE